MGLVVVLIVVELRARLLDGSRKLSVVIHFHLILREETHRFVVRRAHSRVYYLKLCQISIIFFRFARHCPWRQSLNSSLFDTDIFLTSHATVTLSIPSQIILHVLIRIVTLSSPYRVPRLLVQIILTGIGQLRQRVSAGAQPGHVHLLDIFRVASESFLLLLLLLQVGHELRLHFLVSLPQL